MISRNFLLLMFFLSVLLVGCGSNGEGSGESASGGSTFTPVDVTEYETISKGSTEEGDVLIELTPKYASGKLFMAFSANTHSVTLSNYDLNEVMTLEYNGKTLSPVSADSLSGHHSSGNAIFDVGEESSEFTIRIKDIPDGERVFRWEG